MAFPIHKCLSFAASLRFFFSPCAQIDLTSMPCYLIYENLWDVAGAKAVVGVEYGFLTVNSLRTLKNVYIILCLVLQILNKYTREISGNYFVSVGEMMW